MNRRSFFAGILAAFGIRPKPKPIPSLFFIWGGKQYGVTLVNWKEAILHSVRDVDA